MIIETTKYKTLLEEELKRLEKEISLIAEKEQGDDWEPIQTETNLDTADREDVAQSIDSYLSNSSITDDLEKDIIDVKCALDKIENGTYGTCEVCGGEIEEDRLDVNPEAKTCKADMN